MARLATPIDETRLRKAVRHVVRAGTVGRVRALKAVATRYNLGLPERLHVGWNMLYRHLDTLEMPFPVKRAKPGQKDAEHYRQALDRVRRELDAIAMADGWDAGNPLWDVVRGCRAALGMDERGPIEAVATHGGDRG